MSDDLQPDPWHRLQQLTPARIALGHAGTSLPTRAHLDFQFAHARARDAVHLPFDRETLAATLDKDGIDSLLLDSAAPDRHTYLQRPDLGRQLGTDAIARLEQLRSQMASAPDLAIVIADSLSALAVQDNSLGLLRALLPELDAEGWSRAPVLLVNQGRVAIGDRIGELLRARMVLMLIGERPGLSSPDSLGLYFTWGPRAGLTDAERNCISNVCPAGLSYPAAAVRLLYLMREAARRQLSGVTLKDETETPQLGGASSNFLLSAPRE